MTFLLKILVFFIALIHPIQWTIANPVGAVLCTREVAPRTSFLSRQRDIIASFSFGACTVCTDYFVIEILQDFVRILKVTVLKLYYLLLHSL